MMKPEIALKPEPSNLLRVVATDTALLLIAGTLLIVGLVSFEQLTKTLAFTFETVIFLLPFLLFAFALAGFMKASSAEVIITQVFRGRVIAMVFAAAFFGAWAPLCSCTVIAMIAVLLRAGMPLSAVMAFWISSPIISPDMYIYTAALLGTEFATAKLVAAMLMGVFAGFTVLFMERLGGFKNPLKNHDSKKMSLGDAKKPVWKFWREPARVEAFWAAVKDVTWRLGKWMVFAFILESLMMAYIPAGQVGEWVGNSPWAIPLAVIVGVPAYVNGVAAVPLIQGLLSMGMSKPAAMAFLVGGSVTSIPAMMAVFPLVKFRVFMTYIAIALVASTLIGYLYQLYLVSFN